APEVSSMYKEAVDRLASTDVPAVVKVAAFLVARLVLAAMSVAPCNVTVPVPEVKLAAPVMEVLVPRTMLVALVSPMFRAPAEDRSKWLQRTLPVVVMLSALVSIEPRPDVMKP